MQRGNTDPRYQWAALNAFSHYLLRQYDASLSWAREALYLNPNHLQVLAVRAAALAQLERTEEAAKATEVLLGSYPGLTVEKHLRNFRWKNPADIAHYRDGLLKAGVPSTKLTLVEPARSARRIPDAAQGACRGVRRAGQRTTVRADAAGACPPVVSG